MNLRTSIIRLAATRHNLRPYLLPILASDRKATEFQTEEALQKYLKEHPNADKSKHSVKKNKDDGKDDGKGGGKYSDMKPYDHTDFKGRSDGAFAPVVRENLQHMLEGFDEMFSNDAKAMDHAYNALRGLRTLMHAEGEEAAGAHGRVSMLELWEDAVDHANVPGKYKHDIIEAGLGYLEK